MRKIDYVILSFLGVNLILSGVSKKKFPQYFKHLPYFFLFNLIFEILADLMMNGGLNNLFLYHILNPFQFLFLSSIYYLYFDNNTIKNSIIICNIIVFSAAILFATTIQPINTNNSYTNIIKNLFLVIIIVIYFRDLFVREEYIDLKNSYIFIISSALFVTTLGNLMIDFTMNFLMKSDWVVTLYSFSLVIDVIFLIIFIGVYLKILLKKTINEL